MNVFVCAGSSISKNENINNQASKLGELIAKSEYSYAQGGCANGLMGLTLKEYIKTRKDVEFYIPDKYYENDINDIKSTMQEESLKIKRIYGEAERLKLIITNPIIIVLPGGSGTLEELLYCNETLRSNEHNNQLYLVNIDGFYDCFINQLNYNINLGLSKQSIINFKVVNSVDELEFLK